MKVIVTPKQFRLLLKNLNWLKKGVRLKINSHILKWLNQHD